MNKSKKLGSILITAGLIFLASAAGFHLYNLWDESMATDISTQKAALLYDRIHEVGIYNTPAANEIINSRDTDEIMPVMEIDGEFYIGILSIPGLKLDLPVNSKWSYLNLKLTPCRYAGQPQDNNLVIIAHNYKTHFGKITNLSIGDEVRFIDVLGGTHHYKAIEIETVKPTQVDEVVNSTYPLTLFTCNYSGDARIVIRCSMIA